MVLPGYLHFSPDGSLYGVLVEESRLLSSDDFVIMQFTGLLDMNSREIYEGDIVKCLDGYNAEVSWDDAHTGWHPFGSYEGAEWDKSVEVIGNVWEHPELLTPTN